MREWWKSCWRSPAGPSQCRAASPELSPCDKYAAIRTHVNAFFYGHGSKEHVWTLGPAQQEFPNLRIIEIGPGPKSVLWTYVSVGAWEARDESPLEFIITAAEQDMRHVELLTMSSWYHRLEGLGIGHTFPIGESWLPGSACKYFLVSLPFPFGPELEICNFDHSHLHILWLLPITRAEYEFKVREGQEALEQHFDKCKLKYWDAKRKSLM
jgi:hypothetical protein